MSSVPCRMQLFSDDRSLSEDRTDFHAFGVEQDDDAVSIVLLACKLVARWAGFTPRLSCLLLLIFFLLKHPSTFPSRIWSLCGLL